MIINRINIVIMFSMVAVIPPPPSGDAIIRAQAGPSELIIRTTSRVAGAIHSVTWKGKEFIDSTDHGRQLQSASNFDCDGSFRPELFNPTEAGSRADHIGEQTTSRLLQLSVEGPELRTTTQMAFWLRPGEKSGDLDACNDRILSAHILSKRVRIGHRNLPHVIEYAVSFFVPPGERHFTAQFEALAGYMPATFNRFWKFDRNSRSIQPLTDGPGEQGSPVVLSTADGSYAMGVFSPERNPSYGRFRFKKERVNKWNCVFRVVDPRGVKPGNYHYQTFVIVGSLNDVRNSLLSLDEEFPLVDP